MHLKIKNILKSKGVFHEKWKQPINLGTIPIFGDIRSKGLAGAEVIHQITFFFINKY